MILTGVLLGTAGDAVDKGKKVFDEKTAGTVQKSLDAQEKAEKGGEEKPKEGMVSLSRMRGVSRETRKESTEPEKSGKIESARQMGSAGKENILLKGGKKLVKSAAKGITGNAIDLAKKPAEMMIADPVKNQWNQMKKNSSNVER